MDNEAPESDLQISNNLELGESRGGGTSSRVWKHMLKWLLWVPHYHSSEASSLSLLQDYFEQKEQHRPFILDKE